MDTALMPAYLRSVWRELTPARLITMQLLAVVAALYHWAGIELGKDMDSPSLSFALSALIIAELQFNLGLLAAASAREAVRRVRWPMVIYPLVLLSASALTGWSQWHIRDAFHLRVVWDDDDSLTAHRRYGHMIFVGAESLAFMSAIMLVYTNRKKETECVLLARDAELQRSRLENELASSDLAAVRTRIDPAQVVMQLRHLQRLYAEDSPDAETELDALVQELRARTRAARTTG